MSTEIVVQKLRGLANEVAALTNEQPAESIKEVIDLLARAGQTLTARKRSKYATAPHDYNRIAQFLYQFMPDVEVENEFGWYGLYLGNHLDQDPADLNGLTQSDKTILSRNAGAIVHADEHDVTVQLFDYEEDAVDAWEEAIAGGEPELTR
jgi:hypothetical protein